MHKILLFGMTSSPGGKETYILNFIRNVDKTKYECSIATVDEKIAYENEFLKMGVPIIRLPQRSKGFKGYSDAINAVLDAKGYDIVWSHKTTLSSCEELAAATRRAVPCVVVHSHCPSNMGGKLTYVLHMANRLRISKITNVRLACSEPASQWFYGSKDSIIVNNAFETAKYAFDASVRKRIRKQIGAQNRLVIGHAGRFGHEKNQMRLIDVFKAVLDKRPDALLILMGDGPDKEAVQEKANNVLPWGSFIFTGSVNNVHEYVQALDCFVLPSLFEGLPYVLLEAQSAGLRCIASTGVSKESDKTGLVTFLSLDESNDVWAKAILSTDLKRDRAGYADLIAKMGYDSSVETEKICKLLDSFLKQ